MTAVGGLGPAVQQAALAFAHFTGIVPDAALCPEYLAGAGGGAVGVRLPLP